MFKYKFPLLWGFLLFCKFNIPKVKICTLKKFKAFQTLQFLELVQLFRVFVNLISLLTKLKSTLNLSLLCAMYICWFLRCRLLWKYKNPMQCTKNIKPARLVQKCFETSTLYNCCTRIFFRCINAVSLQIQDAGYKSFSARFSSRPGPWVYKGSIDRKNTVRNTSMNPKYYISM